MTLRRALAASPLAVLVAVLSHVAAFGFAHAPGGDRSFEILGFLTVALGLGVVAAFGAGLFERGPHPADRRFWYAPLLLAVAGIAAFGAIEWSESHAIFASLLEATVAAIPLAYVVAWATRAVTSIARLAGSRYGAFVRRGIRGANASVALITREPRAFVRPALLARGATRGRGPPLLI